MLGWSVYVSLRVMVGERGEEAGAEVECGVRRREEEGVGRE